MLLENRFIEKFKDKTKSELEEYLNNPSIYQPIAVEAAKYLIENKDFSPKKPKIEPEVIEEEPELVERAFFKSKILYISAIIFFSFASLGFIITILADPFNPNLLWGGIMTSYLLVLISKTKKTVYYLKLISLFALLLFTLQYVLYIFISIINNTEIEFWDDFISHDLRLIVFYILVIYSSESLVEIRTVPKKKKKNKT